MAAEGLEPNWSAGFPVLSGNLGQQHLLTSEADGLHDIPRCPTNQAVAMPTQNMQFFPPLLSLFSLLLFPCLLAAQQPLTFFAIGDAGEAGPVLDGCAKGMNQWSNTLRQQGKPLGLLLFLGDNFYPIGLNQPEPERTKLIADVLGPHAGLLKSLGKQNVHAIAGNHDYYCRTVGPIPMNSCKQGNIYAAQIPEWTYHYGHPASIRRAIASGARDTVEFILFDSGLPLAVGVSNCGVIFDSLERLLRRSATAAGVKWRIIATHHSPFTVGEHGGWRRWLPQQRKVGYVGNCLHEGDDPYRGVFEFLSNQDNCNQEYQAYADTLFAIINRSGARVQLMMAGHDHSLQLLNYPERTCDHCPKVFAISGAGAKREPVKSPNPPSEFTHPINTEQEQGASAGGFMIGEFASGKLMLRFINAADGTELPMGGVKNFQIDESGRLLAE